MKSVHTIKINFRGGIISPGNLYTILEAISKARVTKVKFGLRQQLLIDVLAEDLPIIERELDVFGVDYEIDEDVSPNIVSSYPAEEVFITNTWLSEGVYKDILDLISYQPQLKINISDSNQSFTPLFTGNINWVASPSTQHFWHLFIRFPKTNVIYEWKDMIYTNDVARMSKQIEDLIFQNQEKFYDRVNARGEELYALINEENFITKEINTPLKLPGFNLPYYEGFNRYNDKYWLGIYRRDESFTIDFLKDICQLCLKTKLGQLCSSPWKSLIIKAIEEKDRQAWSALLAKHQINVRHAANELNFQVEDNCKEGLELKNFLVKHLNNDDTRTFGICFGIKTRKKSEVFSSILIKRRPLLSIGRYKFFFRYDILCAKDFNPNERTGFVFSKGNPRHFLAEQLKLAITSFYSHQSKTSRLSDKKKILKTEKQDLLKKTEYIYQCPECFTVYDEKIGDRQQGIASGVSFETLPENYCCPLCETEKTDFKKVEKSTLGLQTV